MPLKLYSDGMVLESSLLQEYPLTVFFLFQKRLLHTVGTFQGIGSEHNIARCIGVLYRVVKLYTWIRLKYGIIGYRCLRVHRRQAAYELWVFPVIYRTPSP